MPNTQSILIKAVNVGEDRSTFDRWKVAEQEWRDENIELVKIVFEKFCESKEWPQAKALQRALYQQGSRGINVKTILANRPPLPGWAYFGPPERFILYFRDVDELRKRDVPKAQGLLDWILAAARVAVNTYLSGDQDELRVTSEEVVKLSGGLSSDLAPIVPSFASGDSPTPFAGGSSRGDGWQLSISESNVMEFEGATEYQDYIDAQMRIIERTADRLTPTTAKSHDEARPSPRVFIAMPFGEAWSHDMSEQIKKTVYAVDSNATAYRLDDVPYVGRINVQLVEELRQCDLLVADITGTNPNVMWEMGFVHALDKPIVLLRQDSDAGVVPFDIYDYRRVDYGVPFTEAARQELEELLRAVLAQFSL